MMTITLLAASCVSKESADAGLDGGLKDFGEDAGWISPFDPAVCGLRPYTWLDPSTMGRFISIEELPLYSFDKDTMAQMLAGYGYDFIIPQNGISIYRFRYETQDRGRVVEATSLLGVPRPDGGASASSPYILWLHGTSGFSDACAASKMLDWTLAVALIASQGYIAVAPDYIGMAGSGGPSTIEHPYMIGEATAMASLDALRAAPAALKKAKSKAEPEDRVVLWGGSQGGHAVIFTELYAPYYAPRYKMEGALALIPIPSIVRQVEATVRTPGDGTIYGGFIAVAHSRWYGWEDRLDGVLSTAALQTLPGLMDERCVISPSDMGLSGPGEVFTAALSQRINDGTWDRSDSFNCTAAANSVESTPVPRKDDTPFFYVTAERDELVPIESSRAAFDQMCASGYRMEYLECKDALHTNGGLWSMPEQIKWVKDRLAGKPMEKQCIRGTAACCEAANSGPCRRP
jgi:pimeloyl-ACP methyl ester carboxylesterase